MGPDERGRARRPRNAAATREAILAAARVCFTRESYERVGIRDVAAVVGVDAALVMRYFGSKDGLFAAAIAQGFDFDAFVTGDRAGLGERLAHYMIRKGDVQGAFDPLLALLRSSANESVAAAVREVVDEQFIFPMARWLGGDLALQRAGLIAAYLLGLAVARDVIHSQPLSTGEVEPLIALVAPVLQSYVDGLSVDDDPAPSPPS